MSSSPPARRFFAWLTAGKWTAPASTAMLIVWIVVLLFSIADSDLRSWRMQQRSELSRLPGDDAPDNLRRTAEIFRTSIAERDNDFPVERMTSLPAWGAMQESLSGYARHLEMLEAQSEELDRRLGERSRRNSKLSLAAIAASLLLSVLGTVLSKRANRQPGTRD